MSNGKLICFIVPYFGTLPNYFPMFLKSCEINVNYDWLLLTDDQRTYNYPENVKVCYMSFEQLQIRIKKCFPLSISLTSPKKLCDFKPTYGYIFEEELTEYPYWGYCDIDLVLGDLGTFLGKQELCKYQKHFYLGHMSIYENNSEMRKLFLKGYPKKDDTHIKYGVQDVFESSRNMVFDEWSDSVETINEIAESMKVSINPAFPMLDIRPWRSRFYSTVFDPTIHTWLHNNQDNYIVVWKKGKLYAYSKDSKGNINEKEILYAHFQKRYMSFSEVDMNSDSIIFCPNSIRSCNKMTESILKSEMRKAMIRRYFRVDEISKWTGDNVALWKHRYNKYIKKSYQ